MLPKIPNHQIGVDYLQLSKGLELSRLYKHENIKILELKWKESLHVHNRQILKIPILIFFVQKL